MLSFIGQINCVHLVCDTITSTENRIRELLTKARSFSPAVVLLRNIHTLTRDEINNVESESLLLTSNHMTFQSVSYRRFITRIHTTAVLSQE